MKIDFIKLNSTMCTNMTVVPEEFALDFHLLMDERVMIRNRLTARNPPPFCLPLYFFPIITFCVRLYDIVVLNSVLNICIDFETRIAGWPILVLHFDCIRIGQGELFLSKPFTNTTGYQIPLQIQFSKEPYDHVNFENDYNITYDTGLTIEQENQIGTLKID
ncbi:uncharacterized protein LOC122852631 [Aphidius gifuensis]|nr:uncharacterized protein LOC122852631 [Aphidius gifuensis]